VVVLAAAAAAAAAAAWNLPLSRPGNSSPSELHAARKNGRRTSPAGEGRWSRLRCFGGGELEEEEHSRGRAWGTGNFHRDWAYSPHAVFAATAVELMTCPHRRRGSGTWLAGCFGEHGEALVDVLME